MAFCRKEAAELFRVISVLCVCGQILTSSMVSSEVGLGRHGDSMMTDVMYLQDDSKSLRPAHRCNRHDTVTGHEGQSHIGYILSQVHVLMTPGETSTLEGQGHIQGHSCRLQSDVYATDKISSFQDTMNVYRMINTDRHSFKEFHPEFSNSCSENHLTDSGFKQTIATGEHLYAAYFNESFNKLLPKSSHVQVESVPDQPFYQSALGLLHGLLPEKELVRVKVHKASDNFCETTESSLSSCRCDYLTDLKPYISKALTDGRFMFKNSIPDLDDLRYLFGAYSDRGLTALQLLKLFRVARCNGLSSVCDTYGQCFNVTVDTESALEEITARSFQRLVSSPTFREFSEVSAYPFLQRMVGHVGGDPGKVRVYLASQEFLDLMKTSLGLGLDSLMPTASRLVFEVYQKTENQLDAGRMLLKVLLNGEDLTGKVHGCRGNLENGLCPLDTFTTLVSAMQRQYAQKCGL